MAGHARNKKLRSPGTHSLLQPSTPSDNTPPGTCYRSQCRVCRVCMFCCLSWTQLKDNSLTHAQLLHPARLERLASLLARPRQNLNKIRPTRPSIFDPPPFICLIDCFHSGFHSVSHNPSTIYTHLSHNGLDRDTQAYRPSTDGHLDHRKLCSFHGCWVPK